MSNQIKHRSAPWKYWHVTIPFTGWEVIDSENHGICRLPKTNDHDDANVKLITSAPDLLEELQRCERRLQGLANGLLTLWDKSTGEAKDFALQLRKEAEEQATTARAALKKARGE